MKKLLRDYLVLFSISGFVILLDQITKALVRTNIALGDIWTPIPQLPFVRIVHWYNTGVAFGMFQGKGDVFSIIAVIVSVAIIYYFPRVPTSDWTLRIAMGLQMGGALGNLVDRIFQGGIVTDFISVGDFAVFNVADSSITVGVIVLLLGVFIQEWRKPKEDGDHSGEPAGGSDPDVPGAKGEPVLSDENERKETPAEIAGGG